MRILFVIQEISEIPEITEILEIQEIQEILENFWNKWLFDSTLQKHHCCYLTGNVWWKTCGVQREYGGEKALKFHLDIAMQNALIDPILMCRTFSHAWVIFSRQKSFCENDFVGGVSIAYAPWNMRENFGNRMFGQSCFVHRSDDCSWSRSDDYQVPVMFSIRNRTYKYIPVLQYVNKVRSNSGVCRLTLENLHVSWQ